MALPKSYLTTAKNLEGMLNAIKTAQAPPKFTQSFLEGLGFKSSSDRLIIGVLKELGFLAASGEPTERYFQFLDQTRSDDVLAEAVEEAYSDLYQLNRQAHQLPRNDLKNKLKTITRGQLSDAVLDKVVMTFTSLAKHADFAALDKRRTADRDTSDEPVIVPDPVTPADDDPTRERPRRSGLELGGLVYNIQIHLPESRDPAVYDALFRSLRQHLVD